MLLSFVILTIVACFVFTYTFLSKEKDKKQLEISLAKVLFSVVVSVVVVGGIYLLNFI